MPSEVFRVQFNRDKFIDVVHYICAQCALNELGRVKLHKILYFADMLHFAASGQPLTGVEYLKQKFGPVARHLSAALAELESQGRLKTEVRDYYGFPKHDFVSISAVDLSRLTTTDQVLLNDVIDFVCGRTAKEISELSHDGPWQTVAMGHPIPYFLAYELIPIEVTEDDLRWASEESRRLGLTV